MLGKYADKDILKFGTKNGFEMIVPIQVQKTSDEYVYCCTMIQCSNVQDMSPRSPSDNSAKRTDKRLN